MFYLFNRFRKIKREDVTDQIIKYESELSAIEKEVYEFGANIDKLYEKGKKEKNIQVRELIADKIIQSKKSLSGKINRIKFLQYNINVLENLKTAIDDMEFSKERKNNQLNKILRHSKDLNDFLIRSNACRNQLENTLIEANQTFEEFESMRDFNNDIYDFKEEASDVMAQFEMDDDNTINEEEITRNDKKSEDIGNE